MLFTCKNVMFSDFTKKIFFVAPGNDVGGGVGLEEGLSLFRCASIQHDNIVFF